MAKENLGEQSSLMAAASLALDYILNVAVAVAAGVGALVSAVPALLPYTVSLCLLVLALLTLINLRGVRSTGLAFMAPTYLFIACMFGMIAYGLARSAVQDWSPTPFAPVPPPHPATGAVSIGLILRGGPQVVVVSAPWHLQAADSEKVLLRQSLQSRWRRLRRKSEIPQEGPRT